MVIPPSRVRVLVRWRLRRLGFILEGVYGMTRILQVEHGFLDHGDQRLRTCVE